MSWPWSQLGLPGPSDLSQVRHAYAEKLKTTHPEDDPEGFQRLHSAYQLASRLARQRNRRERPVFSEERSKPPEPERPKEEREEQDFNFDELLQDEEERPRRTQAEDEEEQDFDFDELLQDEEGPPPRRDREEKKQDFDFERLFAEGEAERVEARRRRGEERRRAQAQARARERERQKAQEWAKKREYWQRQEEQNTYDRERREHFDEEQARWQNTETILHTIEMMCNAQADRAAWEKFFQSPLFQQMKDSLDLIFGLEDFAGSRQDLPQGARVALFLAYGFDRGVSQPEQQTLFQMLLPAWKAERDEKHQKKLYKTGTWIGGLILAPVALFLLATGWFFAVVVLLAVSVFVLPKFLFTKEDQTGKRKLNLNIIWLLALGVFTFVCIDRGWGLKLPLSVLAVGVAYGVVSGLIRSVRQDEKSGGRPGNKKDDRLIVAVTAVCLVMGISMLFRPELKDGLDRLSQREDPREQVCRYMEEDFGIPFQSIYHITELERHSNVFAPEDDAGKMFLAGPDSERDIKNGKPGYTTNYPEMKVLWALEDFAKARGITGVRAMDQGLGEWETNGTYLVPLSLWGDGEVITELGELMAELPQEDWYQVRTPEYEIVLCGIELKEGRLILSRYKPEDGAFDAAEFRSVYEEDFSYACCGQLIQDNELDRDFIHGGEELYALSKGGMVELKGEMCCHLYGLDGNGEVAMEYYVNQTGGNVYCVPGDFWETGGTEDAIHFYRLVHVEATEGVFHLFYPWMSAT